jgi:acyl-CoA thioesterase I
MRNAAVAMIALTGSVFAEPATVVVLGDSLTAGFGLENAGDGLVPQLEAWLKAQGADVALQNAGVSGDTTAGGLARLDWALGPGVDALVVILGGNDMLRGQDPAGTRANLDGILKKATERGLPVMLVGMQAPRNFGPEYKTAFDAIYPELAKEYGALLVGSFFDGLVAAGASAGDPASFAPFMQADGIHPNPGGVKRIVEGLGPKVMELLTRVKG